MIYNIYVYLYIYKHLKIPLIKSDLRRYVFFISHVFIQYDFTCYVQIWLF